ncbi:hypothetical protein NMY22_g12657 [Coprinellus aureogranulatus]|nr:hypothetical protein NMY22_g12657 [Coprinellus aureogranulatus]
MTEPSKPLEFGVFLPPKYQWLDATGAIDFLNSHSYDYLSWVVTFAPIPDSLLKKAPVINWHWISSAGNLEPVPASSGPPITPTKTFKTAPQLDYILVPGPDPSVQLSTEASDWLKAQHPGLKALLTVCSGSLYIAQTGLLDGVRAATNKFNLKILVDGGKLEKFSKVKWVPDARWVVDGKIWTAAGVTSGLDLAAEFARVHFDKDIVDLTKNAFEYQPNSDKPDPFAFILEDVQLK